MMDQDLAMLAFDEAPIGIVLTEHRIMKSCNATFANLFGYEKRELINRSFRMLYSNRQEFEAIRDIGLKPLQEKGIYSDERIMKRRDGTPFWCRFRARTLTRHKPLQRSVLSFAVISDTIPNVRLTPRDRAAAQQGPDQQADRPRSRPVTAYHRRCPQPIVEEIRCPKRR